MRYDKAKLAALLAGVLAFTGCSGNMTSSGEQQPQQTESAVDEEGTSTQLSGPTAMQVAQEMGPGWNLGNSLDSLAENTFTTEDISLGKNNYQLMATYTTEPYSAWDASQVPYFAESEPIDYYLLEWNMDNLNAGADTNCAKFGVQLINHSIGTNWEANVVFEIVQAEFETKAGDIITLDDMKGVYTKNFTDSATPFVFGSLAGNPKLKTTKDLLGGTFRVGVQIKEYPTLRNSYVDAVSYYETYWGNPSTTKRMIDAVKDAGFKSIRIPVTFTNHMDKNMNIDKEWLARIAEIVNYAFSNDMYCIINIHHDREYLVADGVNVEIYKKNLKVMWKQIAEYFANYGDKLLFESFNEILNPKEDWNHPTAPELEAVNALNQTFVDTVRACGGNNATRYLIVAPYASGVEQKFLDAFQMPTDTVEDRLIAEIHNYDTEKFEDLFQHLYKNFTSKDIPLIIGEWAVSTKLGKQKRVQAATEYQQLCSRYKISCFWWDSGGTIENYYDTESDTYALLDRNSVTWYDADVVSAFTNAYVVGQQ